ncbi:hypothetical protein KIN20_038210 [Parelaphostrongylus tenuis]|uniref:BED-type domain-containing protein n=1 Tax=Parelaphostrongylus tenuis TaxID=148309 RepID=A0AAD5WLF3_PARTN|nr:hypothetical protein KIN20_038210 [Parelaphostrongylus tenuis]
MNTTYSTTFYSYDDKDYFDSSAAVLPTPCELQPPQHGHLYSSIPQSIPNPNVLPTMGNNNYDRSSMRQPSMYDYAAAATSSVTPLVPYNDPPLFTGPNTIAVAGVAACIVEISALAEALKTFSSILPTQPPVHAKDGLTSQKIRKYSTKRGRPTKNPVWKFFRRIDERSVQCNMCTRLVKSACATNMSKHLERHHQTSATKIPNPICVEFGVNHMTVVDNNYTTSPPSPWNPKKKITGQWRTLRPVILLKKDDKRDFCNYCPIHLFNVTLQSFHESNLLAHIEAFDEAQQVDQARSQERDSAAWTTSKQYKRPLKSVGNTV